MCRSPWTSRLAQSTTTSTLWCCSRVTLTSCQRWNGPLRPALSARRPHGQPEGVDCRRSPTSSGNTAFVVTTTTKPTIASTTGRGCGPPLGLLRLPPILPAVHRRPSVVHWRGFSCRRVVQSRRAGLGAGGAARGGGACGCRRGPGAAALAGGRVLGRHGLNGDSSGEAAPPARLGPPAGWRLRRRCRLRPQSGPGPFRRGQRPGGPRQCPAAWRARGGHGGCDRGSGNSVARLTGAMDGAAGIPAQGPSPDDGSEPNAAGLRVRSPASEAALPARPNAQNIEIARRQADSARHGSGGSAAPI